MYVELKLADKLVLLVTFKHHYLIATIFAWYFLDYWQLATLQQWFYIRHNGFTFITCKKLTLLLYKVGYIFVLCFVELQGCIFCIFFFTHTKPGECRMCIMIWRCISLYIICITWIAYQHYSPVEEDLGGTKLKLHSHHYSFTAGYQAKLTITLQKLSLMPEFISNSHARCSCMSQSCPCQLSVDNPVSLVTSWAVYSSHTWC